MHFYRHEHGKLSSEPGCSLPRSMFFRCKTRRKAADGTDHPPFLFFPLSSSHLSLISSLVCGLTAVELLPKKAGVWSRVLDKWSGIRDVKISAEREKLSKMAGTK